MIKEYEIVKKILNELEYLDEAKKYVSNLEKKNIKGEDKFIGKQFNMLKVLEKTDKRSKNR